MGDAGHAGEAADGFVDLSGIGNFDDQAVGGLGDAGDGDGVEGAANGFAELVEEEAAVAALEPELVVVDDDVGGRHGVVSVIRAMRVVYRRWRATELTVKSICDETGAACCVTTRSTADRID